jgi:hypothetical protein
VAALKLSFSQDISALRTGPLHGYSLLVSSSDRATEEIGVATGIVVEALRLRPHIGSYRSLFGKVELLCGLGMAALAQEPLTVLDGVIGLTQLLLGGLPHLGRDSRATPPTPARRGSAAKFLTDGLVNKLIQGIF